MTVSSTIRHLAVSVVFAFVLAVGPQGLTRHLLANRTMADLAPASLAAATAQRVLSRLPLAFERNDGQAPAGTRSLRAPCEPEHGACGGRRRVPAGRRHGDPEALQPRAAEPHDAVGGLRGSAPRQRRGLDHRARLQRRRHHRRARDVVAEPDVARRPQLARRDDDGGEVGPGGRRSGRSAEPANLHPDCEHVERGGLGEGHAALRERHDG